MRGWVASPRTLFRIAFALLACTHLSLGEITGELILIHGYNYSNGLEECYGRGGRTIYVDSNEANLILEEFVTHVFATGQIPTRETHLYIGLDDLDHDGRLKWHQNNVILTEGSFHAFNGGIPIWTIGQEDNVYVADFAKNNYTAWYMFFGSIISPIICEMPRSPAPTMVPTAVPTIALPTPAPTPFVIIRAEVPEIAFDLIFDDILELSIGIGAWLLVVLGVAFVSRLMRKSRKSDEDGGNAAKTGFSEVSSSPFAIFSIPTPESGGDHTTVIYVGIKLIHCALTIMFYAELVNLQKTGELYTYLSLLLIALFVLPRALTMYFAYMKLCIDILIPEMYEWYCKRSPTGWIFISWTSFLSSEALMLLNSRVFGLEARGGIFSAPLSYDAMRWRSKVILWTNVYEAVVVAGLAAYVLVRETQFTVLIAAVLLIACWIVGFIFIARHWLILRALRTMKGKLQINVGGLSSEGDGSKSSQNNATVSRFGTHTHTHTQRSRSPQSTHINVTRAPAAPLLPGDTKRTQGEYLTSNGHSQRPTTTKQGTDLYPDQTAPSYKGGNTTVEMQGVTHVSYDNTHVSYDNTHVSYNNTRVSYNDKDERTLRLEGTTLRASSTQRSKSPLNAHTTRRINNLKTKRAAFVTQRDTHFGAPMGLKTRAAAETLGKTHGSSLGNLGDIVTLHGPAVSGVDAGPVARGGATASGVSQATRPDQASPLNSMTEFGFLDDEPETRVHPDGIGTAVGGHRRTGTAILEEVAEGFLADPSRMAEIAEIQKAVPATEAILDDVAGDFVAEAHREAAVAKIQGLMPGSDTILSQVSEGFVAEASDMAAEASGMVEASGMAAVDASEGASAVGGSSNQSGVKVPPPFVMSDVSSHDSSSRLARESRSDVQISRGHSVVDAQQPRLVVGTAAPHDATQRAHLTKRGATMLSHGSAQVHASPSAVGSVLKSERGSNPSTQSSASSLSYGIAKVAGSVAKSAGRGIVKGAASVAKSVGSEIFGDIAGVAADYASSSGLEIAAVGGKLAASASRSIAGVAGDFTSSASRGIAGVGGDFAASASRGIAEVGGDFASSASRGIAGVGGDFAASASRDIAGVGGDFASSASRGIVGVSGHFAASADREIAEHMSPSSSDGDRGVSLSIRRASKHKGGKVVRTSVVAGSAPGKGGSQGAAAKFVASVASGLVDQADLLDAGVDSDLAAVISGGSISADDAANSLAEVATADSDDDTRYSIRITSSEDAHDATLSVIASADIDVDVSLKGTAKARDTKSRSQIVRQDSDRHFSATAGVANHDVSNRQVSDDSPRNASLGRSTPAAASSTRISVAAGHATAADPAQGGALAKPTAAVSSTHGMSSSVHQSATAAATSLMVSGQEESDDGVHAADLHGSVSVSPASADFASLSSGGGAAGLSASAGTTSANAADVPSTGIAASHPQGGSTAGAPRIITPETGVSASFASTSHGGVTDAADEFSSVKFVDVFAATDLAAASTIAGSAALSTVAGVASNTDAHLEVSTPSSSADISRVSGPQLAVSAQLGASSTQDPAERATSKPSVGEYAESSSISHHSVSSPAVSATGGATRANVGDRTGQFSGIESIPHDTVDMSRGGSVGTALSAEVGSTSSQDPSAQSAAVSVDSEANKFPPVHLRHVSQTATSATGGTISTSNATGQTGQFSGIESIPRDSADLNRSGSNMQAGLSAHGGLSGAQEPAEQGASVINGSEKNKFPPVNLRHVSSAAVSATGGVIGASNAHDNVGQFSGIESIPRDSADMTRGGSVNQAGLSAHGGLAGAQEPAEQGASMTAGSEKNKFPPVNLRHVSSTAVSATGGVIDSSNAVENVGQYSGIESIPHDISDLRQGSSSTNADLSAHGGLAGAHDPAGHATSVTAGSEKNKFPPVNLRHVSSTALSATGGTMATSNAPGQTGQFSGIESIPRDSADMSRSGSSIQVGLSAHGGLASGQQSTKYGTPVSVGSEKNKFPPVHLRHVSSTAVSATGGTLATSNTVDNVGQFSGIESIPRDSAGMSRGGSDIQADLSAQVGLVSGIQPGELGVSVGSEKNKFPPVNLSHVSSTGVSATGGTIGTSNAVDNVGQFSGIESIPRDSAGMSRGGSDIEAGLSAHGGLASGQQRGEHAASVSVGSEKNKFPPVKLRHVSSTGVSATGGIIATSNAVDNAGQFSGIESIPRDSAGMSRGGSDIQAGLSAQVGLASGPQPGEHGTPVSVGSEKNKFPPINFRHVSSTGVSATGGSIASATAFQAGQFSGIESIPHDTAALSQGSSATHAALSAQVGRAGAHQASEYGSSMSVGSELNKFPPVNFHHVSSTAAVSVAAGTLAGARANADQQAQFSGVESIPRDDNSAASIGRVGALSPPTALSVEIGESAHSTERFGSGVDMSGGGDKASLMRGGEQVHLSAAVGSSVRQAQVGDVGSVSLASVASLERQGQSMSRGVAAAAGGNAAAIHRGDRQSQFSGVESIPREAAGLSRVDPNVALSAEAGSLGARGSALRGGVATAAGEQASLSRHDGSPFEVNASAAARGFASSAGGQPAVLRGVDSVPLESAAGVHYSAGVALSAAGGVSRERNAGDIPAQFSGVESIPLDSAGLSRYAPGVALSAAGGVAAAPHAGDSPAQFSGVESIPRESAGVGRFVPNVALSVEVGSATLRGSTEHFARATHKTSDVTSKHQKNAGVEIQSAEVVSAPSPQFSSRHARAQSAGSRAAMRANDRPPSSSRVPTDSGDDQAFILKKRRSSRSLLRGSGASSRDLGGFGALPVGAHPDESPRRQRAPSASASSGAPSPRHRRSSSSSREDGSPRGSRLARGSSSSAVMAGVPHPSQHHRRSNSNSSSRNGDPRAVYQRGASLASVFTDTPSRSHHERKPSGGASRASRDVHQRGSSSSKLLSGKQSSPRSPQEGQRPSSPAHARAPSGGTPKKAANGSPPSDTQLHRDQLAQIAYRARSQRRRFDANGDFEKAVVLGKTTRMPGAEATSDPRFVKLHPSALEHTTVMKNERKFGDLRTSKQNLLSPRSKEQMRARGLGDQLLAPGGGGGGGATERSVTMAGATNIVYKDPTRRGNALAVPASGSLGDTERVVYKDPTRRTVSYADDVTVPSFEGGDDTLAFTQRDVDGKTINARAERR